MLWRDSNRLSFHHYAASAITGRVEIFIGTLLIFLFSYILDEYTEARFKWLLPNCLIVGFSTVLIASFFVDFLKRNIRKASLVLFMSTTYAMTVVSYFNSFSVEVYFLYMIVYILEAFLIAHRRRYLLFFGFTTFIFFVALLLVDELAIPPGILIALHFLIGFSGYYTTATRIKVREKIKERESLLSTLFNQTTDGLIVVLESDYRIVEFNASIRSLFDWNNREEKVDQNLLEVNFKGVKPFELLKDSEEYDFELPDGRDLRISKKEFSIADRPFFVVRLKVNWKKGKSLSDINEKLVLQSEESYRHLFEESSEAICIFDEDGCFIDINGTVEKLLGYKKEELTGKTSFHITAKPHYEEKRRLINKEAWEGKSQKFESVAIAKNGKEVPMEIILRKGKYFSRDVLIANSREISERRKFEQSLAQNQKNLRNIYEHSPVMMHSMDEHGDIIDVNNKWLEVTAYRREEVIGKPLTDFMTKESAIYAEEVAYPKFWKEGSLRNIGFSYRSKKGEIIEVLVDSNTHINPFGKKVSLSVEKDVTEQREYQRRLKESADKFERLFEHAPVGMAIIDFDETFVSINEAFSAMIGYDKEELIGSKLKKISDPNDLKINRLLSDKVKSKEQESFEMEKRYIKKDGSVLHALLKVSYNQAKEGDNLIGQVIDISEIKQVERELRESESSYRELFDNTSDLLYILDEAGKFVDVNEAVVRKYGFSKEEIIGQNGAIFGVPGMNDMDEVMNRQHLAWQGEEQTLLWWARKKNGEVFPKDLQLRKGVYFGKEVILARGRDISSEYEYERKLEENEQRYRNLFQRNLAGVYRTSLSGEIMECNNSFVEILGFDDVDEVKSTIKAQELYVNAEDRLRLLRMLDGEGHIISERVLLKKKNGETIHVLLSASAIYSQNDELEYFEGNLIDITDLVRTEELLKSSQRQYKMLIDNSAFGIVIHESGKIHFSNQKAAEILGFKDAEQLLEKSILDFVQIEDLPFIQERIKTALQGKTVEFSEFKMNTLHGESIDVEARPRKTIYQNKEMIEVTFIDVTVRKKMEEERNRARIAESANRTLQSELKERKRIEEKLINEQSYSMGIIESSIDMIYTAGKDGRINKFNSAAKREFLYEEKEVLGEHISLLFKLAGKSREVLKTLEEEGEFTGEVTCKRKDGSIFPAYLSASYLFNTKGVVMGMMGVSRDISDIKTKEEEIKKQAAKLKAVIEGSAHFFYTIDRAYRLTSFNKNFERDILQVLNKKIETGISYLDISAMGGHREHADFWKEKFDSVFQGESTNFEIRREGVDGQVVYREIFLNPIVEDDGNILELSGIGHDITQKKLAEDGLLKSLAEKEILLKEVHHRVKNNMQVITSILNLQSSYVHDERILNILKESQNRIKSMAYIHESLYRTKDFSKIKFSEYVINLANNLIYTYEIYEDLIEIDFQVEEMFLNLDQAIPCGLIINELISNTLKYAFDPDEEGLIKIVLQSTEGIVHLEISDNGRGIPEQIDFRNTESLGLQLVVTLTQQLQGTIDLDRSEGTKFTIRFSEAEKQ